MRFTLTALLLAGAARAEAPLGRMKSLDFESRFVLAAPHGDFDFNTVPIAWRVCPKIGWDCVAAEGYRRKEHPINVSRPTENFGVRSSDEEEHTPRAKQVYERYLAEIRSVNSDPAVFVGLHGNSRAASAGALEIARFERALIRALPEAASRLSR